MMVASRQNFFKAHWDWLVAAAGLAVLYLCGGLYAALLVPGAWSAFLVYLPADALKLLAAAALAKPLQSRLIALHK